MGVSFSSYLMVGYRLSDIACWETRAGTEVRYDEKTGAAYQKAINMRFLVVLGKMLPEPGEPEIPDEWNLFSTPSGVEIVTTSPENGGDLGEYVWGVDLCHDWVGNGCVLEPRMPLEKAFKRAEEMIADLANGLQVDPSYSIPKPKVYLVSRVSY